MLVEMLEYFFIIYTKLVVIAYCLILIRKDRRKINEDIVFFLIRPFPYFLVSFLIIYIVLPLSIPFTIHELIKEK